MTHSQNELNNISRYLCLILRHKPEEIGIDMDNHGWVSVEELVNKVTEKSKHRLDIETLNEIVDTDTKGRYKFNDDKTRIKCCQGHSISWVEPELDYSREVPQYLYHGTNKKALEAILATGKIDRMSRHAVHMQADKEKAKQSATRWDASKGGAIIIQINARAMYLDGFQFGMSENEVWCTGYVPARYFTGFESVEDGEKA